MVCEDLGGENMVFRVTADGEAFPFARNRQNIGTPASPEYGEMAGATFSGDGLTLYVNCYDPGTTLAVTGPWQRQQR